MTEKIAWADFHLSYFKSGDDMQQCIVKDLNDKIDIEATFNNHIQLMESTIETLKTVRDALLLENKEFDIDADCHHTAIGGDKKTIQKLVDLGVLEKDQYAYENEDQEDDEENEGDEGDEIIKEENYVNDEDNIELISDDSSEEDDTPCLMHDDDTCECGKIQKGVIVHTDNDE